MSLQIRQSPETGHEELVVVSGYYTSVQAKMKPFTLDLEIQSCIYSRAHSFNATLQPQTALACT